MGILQDIHCQNDLLQLTDSQRACLCREIREFGGTSEEEARKIEALWQEIMRAYLACTTCGELARAAHSSHDIHLTDPVLICKLF